ncbi:hypothetical protein [Corynebacterium neomassiliense]|uniref:hypothetical protein n=1 Tax=Corynebacterium neomassiliense TaxID=2079482 RepID=UPI001031F047|nr:hypothetical protein [Corynebacterium neomassiliense]
MSTADENAAKHLSRTSLRDFGPPVPTDDKAATYATHVLKIMPHEAPLPVLLRHALDLIGIPHHGPWEKVAWWVEFQYQGHSCSLSYEKFGLRLRVRGDLTKERADRILLEIRKKLNTAGRTVEKLLSKKAHNAINSGNVTVANQYRRLRRAYDYFRQRAVNPDFVEDIHEQMEGDGIVKSWSHHVCGKSVMDLNASHDLVASISAYLSVLEHCFVLILPFHDFDPSSDELTQIIGDRWGDKWRRVIGVSDKESKRLRERLGEVVEQWRNPYSHGGFEKGYGATVYVHMEGLGALPVGMSSILDSPRFSFFPLSETDLSKVFGLFDDIDAYLVRTFPHAMAWIESGLDVRFDEEFISQVSHSIENYGNVKKLIEIQSYLDDRAANMDY